MPDAFLLEARRFQRLLSAVGGPVFSAPGSKDGIMDRHLFDRYLSNAEKQAGLKKLEGGAWLEGCLCFA
jgi:hypothetical protein